MDVHVCKQCGSHFVYCRACSFRPVRYKEAGFCSKECYEASKKVVAPEVIEEVAVVEEPQYIEEVIEVAPLVVEEAPVEAEAEPEVIVSEEVFIEPEINNETNTYKKKKKEYYVHE